MRTALRHRLPNGEYNIPAGTEAPARQTAKVPTIPSVAACAVTVERKKITDDVALAVSPARQRANRRRYHHTCPRTTLFPPPTPSVIPVGYVRIIILLLIVLSTDCNGPFLFATFIFSYNIISIPTPPPSSIVIKRIGPHVWCAKIAFDVFICIVRHTMYSFIIYYYYDDFDSCSYLSRANHSSELQENVKIVLKSYFK